MDSYFSQKQRFEVKNVLMMDLFLINTQILASQDVNWWPGVIFHKFRTSFGVYVFNESWFVKTFVDFMHKLVNVLSALKNFLLFFWPLSKKRLILFVLGWYQESVDEFSAELANRFRPTIFDSNEAFETFEVFRQYSALQYASFCLLWLKIHLFEV